MYNEIYSSDSVWPAGSWLLLPWPWSVPTSAARLLHYTCTVGAIPRHTEATPPLRCCKQNTQVDSVSAFCWGGAPSLNSDVWCLSCPNFVVRHAKHPPIVMSRWCSGRVVCTVKGTYTQNSKRRVHGKETAVVAGSEWGHCGKPFAMPARLGLLRLAS